MLERSTKWERLFTGPTSHGSGDPKSGAINAAASFLTKCGAKDQGEDRLPGKSLATSRRQV